MVAPTATATRRCILGDVGARKEPQMSSDTFPEKEPLWLGAVLGSIVTAIACTKSDLYASFCRWSENEYVLDGMDGREGVIVFEYGWQAGNGCLVGLFFDPN